MNNILSGLQAAGLTEIKVSTVVTVDVLGVSAPPSAATFCPKASAIMEGIAVWLAGTNNPLFISVYPYSTFAANPYQIGLDYALFRARQPVIDGQYKYYSLFEAMVDAFYAAMDKVGGGNITVVVAETGWPTVGKDPYDPFTNKQNAHKYNQNLIDKMKDTGTPRKPLNILDIFIYAMYSENEKPKGVDQNWGFHYPNMDLVYPLKFK
ncbi:Lichenase-2 [Bienertia sinuspersici]